MLRRSAASGVVTLLSKTAAGRDGETAGGGGAGDGLECAGVGGPGAAVPLGTWAPGEPWGAGRPPQPPSASSITAARPAAAGARAPRRCPARPGPRTVVTPACPLGPGCTVVIVGLPPAVSVPLRRCPARCLPGSRYQTLIQPCRRRTGQRTGIPPRPRPGRAPRRPRYRAAG